MKKRLIPAALTVLVALLFGSCELILDSGGGGGGGDAATRTFWAYNMVTERNYEITATLRASGDKCLVYVENAELDGVSATLAQTIADEFDDDIYATIRTNFGTESDVDGNGMVILLLLDIRDGASASSGYVAGYFDPTDLFSADSAYTKYSNEADMIYLDLSPGIAGDADFYGTIAHEFQHLINFGTTYVADQTEQDVWINEGLSSAAEYLYAGAQIQDRINWYNYAPTTYPSDSDIENGNNFFVWSNNAYVLDEYATVYLFFQWLRIHAVNGSGIYKEILNNVDGYRDYRTVTAAAEERIGIATWEELLRTWLAANVLNSSTGFLGYGEEISTIVTQRVTADTGLSPGEGVYFNVSSPFTFNRTATGSLQYAGIETGAGTVDAIGADNYTGNVGMVFNVNTVKTGLAETGDIASIAIAPTKVSSLHASSRSAGALKPPSAYPISVILQPGGGFHPDSHRPAGATAPSRELDTSARILGSRR